MQQPSLQKTFNAKLKEVKICRNILESFITLSLCFVKSTHFRPLESQWGLAFFFYQLNKLLIVQMKQYFQYLQQQLITLFSPLLNGSICRKCNKKTDL